MICRPDTLRPFRIGATLHRFDLGNRGALESLLAHTKLMQCFILPRRRLIPQSVINPGPFSMPMSLPE